VQIFNGEGGQLQTVDASGMQPGEQVGLDTEVEPAGLFYVSDNARAESIVLGGGVDRVILDGSTLAGMATVAGMRLVESAELAGALEARLSYMLMLLCQEELSVDLATSEDLYEPLHELALRGTNAVLHLAADSYVFAENGNQRLDESDVLVR